MIPAYYFNMTFTTQNSQQLNLAHGKCGSNIQRTALDFVRTKKTTIQVGAFHYQLVKKLDRSLADNVPFVQERMLF